VIFNWLRQLAAR